VKFSASTKFIFWAISKAIKEKKCLHQKYMNSTLYKNHKNIVNKYECICVLYLWNSLDTNKSSAETLGCQLRHGALKYCARCLEVLALFQVLLAFQDLFQFIVRRLQSLATIWDHHL